MMYRDINGNIVDMAIAGSSTIKRTNLGRFFEQFFNAMRRDNVQRMRETLDLDMHLKGVTPDMLDYAAYEHPKRSLALDRLKHVYEFSSAKCRDFLNGLDEQGQYEHLRYVLEEDAYLHMPPNNEVDALEAAQEIIKCDLMPTYAPVQFINSKGQHRTTRANMLTGEMYIVLLEKMPTGWAATASPRYQHLGIPSKLNNSDKHGSYGREQVVRTTGESEVRAWLAFMGPYFTTSIMDLSNNPNSHRHAIYNLITSDNLGEIEEIVDRKEIPLGDSRPVKFTNNIINCAGIKFTNRV